MDQRCIGRNSGKYSFCCSDQPTNSSEDMPPEITADRLRRRVFPNEENPNKTPHLTGVQLLVSHASTYIRRPQMGSAFCQETDRSGGSKAVVGFLGFGRVPISNGSRPYRLPVARSNDLCPGNTDCYPRELSGLMLHVWDSDSRYELPSTGLQ